MTIQEILDVAQPGLFVLSVALAAVTVAAVYVLYLALKTPPESEAESKTRKAVIRKSIVSASIGILMLSSVLSAALSPGKMDRDEITARLRDAVEKAAGLLESEVITQIEKGKGP